MVLPRELAEDEIWRATGPLCVCLPNSGVGVEKLQVSPTWVVHV